MTPISASAVTDRTTDVLSGAVQPGRVTTFQAPPSCPGGS